MKRQRGAALMVILMIVGALGAFFAIRALNGAAAGRDGLTATALAQGKDALIGSALAYRDQHPNQVPGFLLLPDLGSTRNSTPFEGVSAGTFGTNTRNLSVLGRLPWRTLGLSPLRDSAGECLWYAVSGAFQDGIKVRFMNWDTLGQFDTFTSNGTPASTVSTIGANDHQRPVALVFAPGATLTGQVRATIGADVVSECRGNYDAHNYLDTFNPNPSINNIVNYLAGPSNRATASFVYAAPKQVVAGPVVISSGDTLVNDRFVGITADDVFRAIGRRSDFAGLVKSEMLDSVAATIPYVPASAPATITFTLPNPVEVQGGTLVGSLEIGRVPQEALGGEISKSWQDNLLYARCASGSSCLTVNASSCTGVVIFAGRRLAGQTRASNTQKNTWGNYLEGSVLTAFTTGSTTFVGATDYFDATPDVDLLACVGAASPSTVQASFAANFGGFQVVGAGVTPNPATQSVAFGAAAGSAGGCFWSPTKFDLLAKTLRAYYEFTFSTNDTYALTGAGLDRGNGFALQMVTGQYGVPPNTCGTEVNMGILGAADVWGVDSFIFETDVYRDAAHDDPVENHSAILLDGFLDHAPSAPSATISAACDGSATGCRHSPANKFEESPSQPHNQRIEIHSGCNAACTVCNPPAHASPNDYVRITAWVDCKNCSSLASDINRVTQPPTMQRCVALSVEMKDMFFGFTGGFQSGARLQGVTLTNASIRSQ